MKAFSTNTFYLRFLSLLKTFLSGSTLLFSLSINPVLANQTTLFEHERASPLADSGVIDLREWNFKKDGPATLSGEWDFYWMKLYQAEDLNPENNVKPDASFPVPRRWGGFKLDNGQTVPPKGYATLRLKVLMPQMQADHEQPLRLFLGSSDTSFRLLALDKENLPLARLLSGGDVAESRDQYRAMWVRDSAPLKWNDEITLIWHISNFDMLFDGGGPKKPPIIGLDRDIMVSEANERSFNAVTTGIMLVMAIYHLIIFTFRAQEGAPLWFGLSCLSMAAYSFLTPHYLEQNFPDADYFELLTKFLFLTSTLSFSCNLLFVRSLFPQHSGNILWKLIITVQLSYCLLVAIFPLHIYDNFRAVIAVSGLFSTTWYSMVFFKAILKDNSKIGILLGLGFGIFGITAASDFLVANAVIALPYLSSYGLSIFILFQATVIAIQNQQTHKEKLAAQKNAAESNRKALLIEQEALKEQKLLTESFQRFVPADFLRLLGKERIQDVALGDFAKKEMSVLFSDIRSFTTLSESMSPEDNFKFLNSYLKRMEPVIHKNHGVIDKYIGDAIMATFSGSSDDAIKAALGMITELKQYNFHREKSGYPAISIGIGINTGQLMLGTIGGADRMEGTVISDAVNLAARLEGLTKMYGASIAVSADTLHNSSIENFEYRILDTVIVKGKSEPVTIYEVLDAEDEQSKMLKLQSHDFIVKSIEQRRESKLQEAKTTLENALDLFPEDQAIKNHLENIEKLILLGLPDNWLGAIILDSK